LPQVVSRNLQGNFNNGANEFGRFEQVKAYCDIAAICFADSRLARVHFPHPFLSLSSYIMAVNCGSRDASGKCNEVVGAFDTFSWRTPFCPENAIVESKISANVVMDNISQLFRGRRKKSTTAMRVAVIPEEPRHK
jgi:hypothetical protein